MKVMKNLVRGSLSGRRTAMFAAFAAVFALTTFAGGLPVNPELPVSFGINSRGGDRLKGEFLDAAIYSTVLTPKTIEAAARGVKPSVKPLWSGVPKAGDKCEAVRTAKFPQRADAFRV